VLHLTNGDGAVPSLRAAGVEGEIVTWGDVLHDGPLPDRASRRARDERLEAALASGEEIRLWFEADLFDVLNLLQILDRVPPGSDRVRLVLVGQERWESVTHVEPERLAALGREVPLVSDEQFALAREAWAAFTSPTPLAMERLVRAGTPALPVVGHVLHRLLEELPWVGDGLGRTKRQLREARAAGATRVEAFQASMQLEERPFLGDTTAWRILDRRPDEPRWVGGWEIPPGESPWLWDPDAGRVVCSD
jgi:hypothetical protein